MKIRLLCCCAALLGAALLSSTAQADIYATEFYDSSFNGSIDVYSDSGTLIQDAFITGLNTPTSLVRDASGNFYVSSRFGGTVHAFGPDGLALATAPGAAGLYGDASGDFAQLGGLAFNASGDLYATDNGTNTIYIFDGSSTTAASTLLVPNGNTPLGMPTFDSAGNLYVTSFATNEVYKYDGSSFSTIIAAGAGGVFNPSGVAVDDSGNIYVSGLGSSSLHVYDSSGTPITAIPVPFSPPSSASFFPSSAPGGLSIDANGDIIVGVLGASAPGDVAGGAPFPLGGILRYTPGDSSFTVLTQDTGAYSSVLVAPNAVPEPSSLLLASMGGIMLLVAGSRVRRKKANR